MLYFCHGIFFILIYYIVRYLLCCPFNIYNLGTSGLARVCVKLWQTYKMQMNMCTHLVMSVQIFQQYIYIYKVISFQILKMWCNINTKLPIGINSLIFSELSLHLQQKNANDKDQTCDSLQFFMSNNCYHLFYQIELHCRVRNIP